MRKTQAVRRTESARTLSIDAFVDEASFAGLTKRNWKALQLCDQPLPTLRLADDRADVSQWAEKVGDVERDWDMIRV